MLVTESLYISKVLPQGKSKEKTRYCIYPQVLEALGGGRGVSSNRLSLKKKPWSYR